MSHIHVLSCPMWAIVDNTNKNTFIISEGSEDIIELDLGFKLYCKIHISVIFLNLFAWICHLVFPKWEEYVLLIMMKSTSKVKVAVAASGSNNKAVSLFCH